MKKIIFYILLSFCSTSGYSQIAGSWSGRLNFGNDSLLLIFHIGKSGNIYKATLDSPDQGARGIPFKTVIYRNDTLILEMPEMTLIYTGILIEPEIIKGVFSQHGNSFDLDLFPYRDVKPDRPQEPKPPFPYVSEDVKFKNETEDFYLAGTLNMPAEKGKFPAVVMITGSGLQNRDQESFGHKPFLVIADYLTRNGIAVLRFDDRGVAESEGNPANANTMDFAADVESAVTYLKTREDIDQKNIGLIGHSEGGLISFILASRNDDISFIVSMAGTGIRGDSLIYLQTKVKFERMGKDPEWIRKNINILRKSAELVIQYSDKNILRDKFAELFNVDPNSKIIEQQLSFFNPWMLYFLQYDPTGDLQQIKCPVFAINGEKDYQVPPKENLTAIKTNIEKNGNKKVTIKEYPSLNHLFQTADTGLYTEYEKIEETISPEVLNDMAKWILSVIK